MYPAVLLAYGRPIALLPAMAAGIQSGLKALTQSLCRAEKVVDSQGEPIVDSEGRPTVKRPNPRVELPYTYLMAWYVMHCPSLMTRCLGARGLPLSYSGWRIQAGATPTCISFGNAF